MCVYLHTKFQVSSIILKSFRHGGGVRMGWGGGGGNFTHPTSKQTSKKPTQIRVKLPSNLSKLII